MTNAGTATAAGLVPGARLCQPRASKAVAGECVPSRKLQSVERGSALHDAGDALGKAVQTRGCAYGWCRARYPDERDDSDSFSEELHWWRHAMWPHRCMSPWSEAKRSYEAARGRAASYVSELAVNTRSVFLHGGFHRAVWFSVRLWNWRRRTRNVVRNAARSVPNAGEGSRKALRSPLAKAVCEASRSLAIERDCSIVLIATLHAKDFQLRGVN